MKDKTKGPKRNRRHERGAVLSIAILVGVVLLIMAVPFFFKLSGQYRSTDRSVKALSAFNLAEAGVERALYEISHFSYLPWVINDDGSQTATLAGLQTTDGNVVGNVDISFSPIVNDKRSLSATGRIPYLSTENVSRTVIVNLEKHLKSIFDFGIFADEYIYAKANWLLDSYNSDDGPYDEDSPGPEGHAGINNTADNSLWISQGMSSDITGNLAAGYGSSPDDLLDIINLPDDDPWWLGGDRKILPAEFELPSVNVFDLPPQPGIGDGTYTDDGDPMFAVPDGLDISNWFNTELYDYDGIEALDLAWVDPAYLQGDFEIGKKDGTVVLGPADSGVYTDFILNNQSDVQISGNVVLFITGGLTDLAEFSMSNGSSLQILPDSSLTLILGSTTFEMINNTILNESQIPSNLMVFGTDQFTPVSVDSYNMYWNNNVDTYAGIYVPRARVKYEPNTDLYGALLSFSLDIKNNVDFHYDEALKKIDWVKGGIPYYIITSWQERVY